MKSLWSDREAEQFRGDLALRVYTSRLLGRDKSLVLHGGGNTSVKIRQKNLFGDEETILYVKGSGWDLETIEPQGFSPVLLAHVLRLAELPSLSDPQMVNQLVTLAEDYLDSKDAWMVVPNRFTPGRIDVHKHAELRRKLSDTAGVPLILKTVTSDRTLSFAQHPDIARISQQGPATPDHVIRTKRTPMIGTDVTRFVEDYKAYFGKHAAQAKEPKTILDPAPRVVLDPSFGLAAAGRSAKDAAIVDEIYDHTIDVILRAEELGGFQALPAKDIFDVEYWDLEQAKLRKGGKAPAFAGEVALVTGAASGIGKAAEMCGALFGNTTGAHGPVAGGEPQRAAP